jgi:hypothetical protein
MFFHAAGVFGARCARVAYGIDISIHPSLWHWVPIGSIFQDQRTKRNDGFFFSVLREVVACQLEKAACDRRGYKRIRVINGISLCGRQRSDAHCLNDAGASSWANLRPQLQQVRHFMLLFLSYICLAWWQRQAASDRGNEFGQKDVQRFRLSVTEFKTGREFIVVWGVWSADRIDAELTW